MRRSGPRALAAILAVVVGGTVLPPAGAAAGSMPTDVDPTEERCERGALVQTVPTTAAAARVEQVGETLGADTVGQLPGGWSVLETEPERRDDLVDALAVDPSVLTVLPDAPLVPALHDRVEVAASAAARELYNDQLGVIGAPRAWRTSEGRRQVRVAVLDDQADVSHPALAHAVPASEPDPTTGPHAHGTHVAGLVVGAEAARTVGVAPGAGLLTFDVFCGTHLPAAIQEATRRDARVINLSLVLDYGRGHPPEGAVAGWTRLLRQLLGEHTVLVAAAGNDRSTIVPLPAAVDLPQVLSVAASDGDRLADFSNRSAGRVHLAAPGRDIRSTAPGGGYARMSGTSMAAPHVAGAAALVVSARPSARASEVARLLTATARRSDRLVGTSRSGGVLDVGRAVGYLDGDHGACPAWIVPPRGFRDVERQATHGVAIDCIAWWRITLGRDASRFDPRTEVTRAEMAAFLARLLDAGGLLPATAPDAFGDDDGSTHERAIDRLAAVGVVRGTSAGRFTPDAPVTREQMAAFLDRTLTRLLGRDLDAPAAGFRDTATSPHRRSIDAVAALGVARGVEATRFEPRGSVTREQMASFLARTLDRGVRAAVLTSRL